MATRSRAVWLAVAVSVIMLGGAALTPVGQVSGAAASSGGLVSTPTWSVETASSAVSSAVAPSQSWTIGELQAAPLVAAPYQEPGLDLVGATYLGPVSLVSAADPSGTIPLVVSLDFSNASELNALLAGLSDPASPEYHQYLTHAEFDEEFGGVPSVYNSLVQYVASFGVSALTTHPDRLTVTFQATPAQISSLFDTTIGSYLSAQGQAYYAPTTTPMIAAPLLPYITEVGGLSDYSMYTNHVDSTSVTETTATAEENTATGSSSPTTASPLSPGGASNPFSSTTVGGVTYDQPVSLTSSTSCYTNTCGELMEAADLQATYNESGLLQEYGYPVNATVVAMLWSDPVCTSNTSMCNTDAYYNTFCGTLTSGSYAWDFFMPDETSYWNYTLPAGEPMPRAVSMPITGSSAYAYPAGSQGYSASCDDGGAEGENTLDVAMEGSMAPGANVFQVFGQGSSDTTLVTEFSDILSPTAGEFSTTGGFNTAENIADLENASIIANSWGGSAIGPSWNNDLVEAQVLGITVLASTGDTGTSAIQYPAGASFNHYGAVAVGGTTLVVDPTTLARTPDHLATMAPGYDGVGGGEIVWYEPGGTTDGFGTANYGTVGGVTTTTANYAPTWQNSSANAHSIITGIRASDGRGEPDVSAIANDTVIDLDNGYYSFNITCIVDANDCTRISNIGSNSLEVGWTYFIGTSISVQATGGMIGVIDYDLYSHHQGRLGFVNPTIYPVGQLQFQGDLTLHSFKSITTYHNAESATTYGAFADGGWNADDGWGTIDAGNFTQNTLTYNINFTESGLVSGTQWSVTLTPMLGDANCTVSGSTCSNSVQRTTTYTSGTSTLSWPEVYGSYTYTVAPVAGYTIGPSSGTISQSGASVDQEITFSPSSPIQSPPTANPITDDVGESVTFTAVVSGGTGPGTYVWTYGALTGCTPSTSATLTCVPTATFSGTVFFAWTDQSGTPAAGNTDLTYTVNPAPTQSPPSAVPTAVDSGQSVTFTAAVSGGTSTGSYVWSYGSLTGCTASTSSTLTCVPTAAFSGTVSFAWTDGNGVAATGSTGLSYIVDPALLVPIPTSTHNPVDAGLQSVTFGASPSEGSGTYSTYLWAGLPTSCAPANAATITCTPSTQGSFSVTVKVTDSNSNSVTSGALSFTVNAAPTQSPPTAVPVGVDNVGSPVTFTAAVSGGTGAGSYVWSFGALTGCAASTSSTLTCTPTGAFSGTISYAWTDGNGIAATGSTSLSYTVETALVVPTPTVTINPVDAGLQSVTFTAAPAGGSGTYTTYLWSGLPTGCTAANSATIVCTPSTQGSYSVTVKVTDSNSNSVTSAALSFTVHAAPTQSAPAAVPAADDVGESVTFTAVVSGGTGTGSYVWSYGALTGCAASTSSTLTCVPTGTFSGSVSFAWTDGNGIAATGSTALSYTVHAAPTQSAPTPVPAVDEVGESVTFTAVVSGGTGTGSYSWSYGALTGCTPSTGQTLTCVPTATFSGTVSYAWTDGNGIAATGSTALSYTVAGALSVPTPTVTINPVDAGLQLVTFTAAPAGGSGTYTTYLWSGLPTGCTAENTATIICTPSTQGSFSVTVKVTDSNSNSVTSSALSFTVNAAPTQSAPTAVPAADDVGESVTFTAVKAGGTGAGSYVWSFGTLTGCSPSTSSTLTCVPTATFSGTVSFAWTDGNGIAATGVTTLSYTVRAAPTQSPPTSIPTTDEVGESVTFTAVVSGGTGTGSYVWSFGALTGCTASTTSTLTCVPTTTFSGTVSFAWTDGNGIAATGSTSLSFTVVSALGVPTPTVTINPVDAGLQSVTFTASPTNGALPYSSYTWVGLPTGCTAANTATITCTPSTQGSYSVTVKVTDANSISVTSSALSFTVHAAPTQSPPTALPSSVDIGQSVTFTAVVAGGTGTGSYVWSFGSLTGCTTSTTSTLTCVPTAAFSGSVSFAWTDGNGIAATGSASLSFSVNGALIVPAPTATINPADAGLQSVTFTAAPTGGSGTYSTYLWTGLPTGCTAANSATIVCTPSAHGSYSITVKVTDSDSNAVTSGALSFTVNSAPTQSSPTATPTTDDVGESVTFTAVVAGGTGTGTFVWSYGSLTGCTASTTSTLSCVPTATFSGTVSFAWTDGNGIAATGNAELSYTVNAAPLQSPPNADPSTGTVGVFVEFTAEVSGGSGTGSYVWSYGALTGCTPSASSTLLCVPSATFSGTISFNWTDGNGVAATGPTELTYTVNAAPPPPPPTYTITFTETGLPAGTAWSVTLDGTLSGSTTPVITFSEANGMYGYSIAPIAGYTAEYSGQVTVSNAAVSMGVPFTAITYGVAFNETGLPTGTSWTVVFDDVASSSTTATISFSEANGSYAFTVDPVPGFTATPASGSTMINGSAASVSIAFAAIPPSTYTVTFTETGLPAGTSWSVTLNDMAESGSGASISFTGLENATYVFSVAPVNGYTVDPASGSVTVNGGDAAQGIAFTPIPPATYDVTFSETGLPAGTSWSVTLNGATESGVESSIVFSGLENGTYAFEAGAVGGFIVSPSSGTVTVDGADASQVEIYSTIPTSTYTVTFTESGLAPGTSWSVALNGVTQSGPEGSLSFSGLVNASYSFTVGPVGGFTVSPSSGSVVVDGADASEAVVFTALPPSTFTVTFNETGLPDGTFWSVTLNSSLESGTNSSIVFVETGVSSDGTRLFVVSAVSGYVASPSSGAITTDGANVTQAIVFTPIPPAEYVVTFTEMGLPLGTLWGVEVNSGSPISSTGTSITMNLLNGTYAYAVESANLSYAVVPPTGNVTVSGAAASVGAPFVLVYSASITAEDLPAGTLWFVNVTGTPSPEAASVRDAAGTVTLSFSGTGSTITFSLPNGTWTYTVASTDPAWAPSASSSTGTLTVSGAPPAPVRAAFVPTYVVTFTETGLGSGATWSVTFNGTTKSLATTTITFTVVNGTYTFSVGAVSGYTVSPSVGSVPVNGGPMGQTIAFSSTSTSSPSSSYWVWAIVAVVIVLIVIGVALMRRRPKAPRT